MSLDSLILLDVSRSVWRAWRGQLPTGIDRACLAYVRHYRRCASAVVQRGGIVRVLDLNDSRHLFDLLLDRRADFRRRLMSFAGCAFIRSVTRAEQLRDRLYLNVGHTGLDQPGQGRWIERNGIRPVYFVHDLIPITHPQFARVGEPEKHARRMVTVLRHGAAVIANSRDSVDQFQAFARTKGLGPPPMRCIPLGLELPTFDYAISSPIGKPYFVILGTIEGRKNHALLLNVWRHLADRMVEATPKLVIIGQRGWSAGEVIAALDGDMALRPHVIELGRCTDSELRTWLAHARALLFPSFVEGQGLPLIEALAMGTPVIASNLGVFYETAGTVPDYLDPCDTKAWVDAALDYISPNSMRRIAQLSRMAGFRAPTWEGHFLAVDKWLREL